MGLVQGRAHGALLLLAPLRALPLFPSLLRKAPTPGLGQVPGETLSENPLLSTDSGSIDISPVRSVSRPVCEPPEAAAVVGMSRSAGSQVHSRCLVHNLLNEETTT